MRHIYIVTITEEQTGDSNQEAFGRAVRARGFLTSQGFTRTSLGDGWERWEQSSDELTAMVERRVIR